jgi:hypothetical protein
MTVSIARPMVSMRHCQWVVAALALTTLGAAAWPFTVDDAFIVARYASRIAHGLGYTYSSNSPSDGVTGPLLLLPLAAGARAGLDPLPLAKWLSLAAGLVAVLLVIARTRRGQRGDLAAWCATAVACSSLPLVVWSVAGLETGVAALSATALALAVTARPEANMGAAALALSALAWLRPELLPFGGTLAMSLGLRRPAVSPARVLAAGAFSVLLLCAFRLALFDHLWPLSASAKPALLGHGYAYVLDALARPRSMVLFALLCCAFWAGGRSCRVLVVALIVHASAVLLAGGDWMPARRLFAPVVPTMALSVALGLRVFALRRPGLSALLVLLLLTTSALELASELPRVRAAGALQKQRIPALSAAICRARGPVAIVDLGAVSQACPAQTFIDLGGLTEPAIAYARGAHLDKRIDEAWLRAQRPGLVVLHSRERPRMDEARNLRWFAGYPVERRVLSFAFMRDYQVQEIFAYTPSYFYVLMVPRGAFSRPSLDP